MTYLPKITKFKEKDKEPIKVLIKELYFSPAVLHKPSEQIIENIVNACLDKKTNVIGYKLVYKQIIVGYFILAKSFSTEYGVECIWLEDLFIKEEYRNKGFGKIAFDYIQNKYTNKGIRLRLEVEENNYKAINFYTRNGMIKNKYIVMEINPK